jgi:hypothetical protein
MGGIVHLHPKIEMIRIGIRFDEPIGCRQCSPVKPSIKPYARFRAP